MRPGTLPAINYYDLVKPQQQFQNAISATESNQAGLVQGVATSGVGADQLAMTGAFRYLRELLALFSRRSRPKRAGRRGGATNLAKPENELLAVARPGRHGIGSGVRWNGRRIAPRRRLAAVKSP